MTTKPILEANLQALHRKSPQLASEVASHTVDDSNIEFIATRDNVPTLRYRHWNGDKVQQHWLHSRYHPISEAQKFAEQQSMGAQIVLYGFALGYHVRALAAAPPQKTRFKIVEANLDFLKTALSIADFTELITAPNTEFLAPGTALDAIALLETERLQGAYLAVYRPAVTCLGTEFTDLKLYLNQYLMPGVWAERQQLAAANHRANLQVESQPIWRLFGKHSDETAVIVSSGPSLQSFQDILRQLSGHAVLLCVGSALRFLINHQITPNYVVIMDALHLVEKQLNGFTNNRIPLLFSNYANAAAVKSYQGPKYMFLCEPIPDFPNEMVLSTGGSVANSALGIALKMGVKRVVFIGQDLCFAGGQHHVPGTWLGPNTVINDKAFYIRLKNVRDEWVSTEPKMLSYLKWFEKTIASNPNVRFLNISDNGLPIQGATTVSNPELDQIING